jgi:hypothetical protein
MIKNMETKRMMRCSLIFLFGYIDEIWIVVLFMKISYATRIVRDRWRKVEICTFHFQLALGATSWSMKRTLYIIFPLILDNQMMLRYVMHIVLLITIFMSSSMGHISCSIRSFPITLQMHKFSLH